MLIKYIVWKYEREKHKKRKTKFEHGEIEFGITDFEKDDHTALREAIMKKHPEQHLAGYCEAARFEQLVGLINYQIEAGGEFLEHVSKTS